eukprot:gene5223-18451_t
MQGEGYPGREASEAWDAEVLNGTQSISRKAGHGPYRLLPGSCGEVAGAREAQVCLGMIISRLDEGFAGIDEGCTGLEVSSAWDTQVVKKSGSGMRISGDRGARDAQVVKYAGGVQEAWCRMRKSAQS